MTSHSRMMMAVAAVAEVYQEGAATVVMNQLFCVTDQLFFFFLSAASARCLLYCPTNCLHDGLPT